MSRSTINAILTHLPADRVAATEQWWCREMAGAEVLFVYGGNADAFGALDVGEKVFVEGEGHRTRDHQRERQSYSGVLGAIARWLDGKAYRYVNLIEFDVLPLRPDWIDELESAAERDGAGLLAHDLQRVDRTGNVHFLNHSDDPAFAAHWRSVSRRDDPSVVLSILGCHTFWRRDALEAVAARPEPLPIYLELYMPTLAHHLGFRVRRAPGGETMRAVPEFTPAEIEAARAAGAGSVHPVKGGVS